MRCEAQSDAPGPPDSNGGLGQTHSGRVDTDPQYVKMTPVQVPETHYARAGDLRIAYQQWGEGPPLVFIPALISNIEIPSDLE